MFFNDGLWGNHFGNEVHPNRSMWGVQPSFSDYLPHMLRSGEVRRWHTIHVTRDQTLAEHNFNVLAISLAIVDEFNEQRGADERDFTSGLAHNPVSDIDSTHLARLVAFHDLHEIWTGDFPSPIKRLDAKLVRDIKQVAEEKFIGKTDFYVVDPRLFFVMKMADMLDALWFITQYGHGEYAHRVQSEITFKVGAMIEEIGTNNKSLAHAIMVIKTERMGPGSSEITHLEE